MRGFWVGAGVASLLVTGLTAPPVAAAEPAADTTVQAVTPGPNPTISETCGLDATLILDASGSIKSAGAVNTVRNASYDLLAALKDTNSTLRVTQFGTFSGQLSSRVDVNASTVGTGGNFHKRLPSTTPPRRPSPPESRSTTATGWTTAPSPGPTGRTGSRTSIVLSSPSS